MAKKTKHYESLPQEFVKLPKKVRDAVAYWATHTFYNERQTVSVEGYTICVNPIVSTAENDSKEYAVVRVFKGLALFQGWLPLKYFQH